MKGIILLVFIISIGILILSVFTYDKWSYRQFYNRCVENSKHPDWTPFCGKNFIKYPLITKDYRAYSTLDGNVIEYSYVDKGQSTEFKYAEIEFYSEEKANKFIPPKFLGKEVTYDPYYKMKNYWERKYL